jgi:hypothetical protein
MEILDDEDGENINERKKGEFGTLYMCFCSNDGWHVTPMDCKHIAHKLKEFKGRYYETVPLPKSGDSFLKGLPKALMASIGRIFDGERKHLSEDDLDWVQKFGEYCERASELGGFYVW